MLTAGSGHGTTGRLSLSRSLAAQTQSSIGSLFGRYLDREIYDAILARNFTLFADWTDELTDALVACAPELVVVDSWQFYNVAHDLAHLMGRLASARAARRLDRPIEVVEFAVVPPAVFGGGVPQGSEAFRIELDESALKRKHAEASRPEIHEESKGIIAVEGVQAQRVEVFRRPVALDAIISAAPTVPPYEYFGEKRVAEGIYRQCIRWRDHVLPIVEAIQKL